MHILLTSFIKAILDKWDKAHFESTGYLGIKHKQ